MASRVEEIMLEEARAGSIPRKLGDELIDAARDVVGVWRSRDYSSATHIRFTKAIAALEALVGSPT